MWRSVPLALVVALLGGCADDCGNEVVSRVDAPNGSRSAVMFQRDCGATTGFSTQISIVDAGEQPSGGGNAFRADDDHGAAPVGDWGGPWAEVKWVAPDQLLVRYAAKSRIFEQDETVSGVRISYEAVAH